MTFKHFKLLSLFALCTNMIMAENLYDQLIPELTKHIDIENPKKSDLSFINACRAHSQGGTKFSAPLPEILHAIKSIEMFITILPKYARTLTNFGYIAMARLCAQMTDNLEILSKKVALQNYFDQNNQVVHSLDQIIQNSVHAEQRFTDLFKQISEEEQLELDKIDKQLYFSKLGLDRLNETASALEVGPRVNQLHTAAWCIIPSLIASSMHKQINYWNQRLTLEEQVSDLNTAIRRKTEYSTKEYADTIQSLEEEIQSCKKMGLKTTSQEELLAMFKKYQDTSLETLNKDLFLAQKTSNDHNKTSETTAPKILVKIQEELKKIDASKLTDDEKNILKINSDSYIEVGIFVNTHRMQFISAWLKTAGKEGISNLPSFVYDATVTFPKYFAKKVYNDVVHLAKYNSSKNSYIEHGGYDKDSMAPKIYAGIATSLHYSMIAIGLSIYPGILYWRYNSTKNLLDLIHEKQQDLLAVGHLVKSMQMVHKVIASDATLTYAMSQESQKLGELFDAKSQATSADLKKLVNALLSSSFQGDDSYFLSQEGKILATHHLLVRIKNELVPYLEAFGQVDASIAIAKLYKEFKNHPNVHFCLPEFVDSAHPVLEADAYWHPMIDPNKVVINSLNMNDHTAANLLITGPNAGGKTTSLMSLIINVIFAQSFGIAPSSSLRLTPFAKIHSYLDITTNLQEGLSLFAAEVDRAKKLKVSILGCTPGQKTFTIIDEIFSGTDPKVASDVGFTFAAQLGEMKHSMTIITTHFPALTGLEEKTGRYINYKVADATIHSDGSITYPFKLIPGISSQNIAAQMLHNQGII